MLILIRLLTLITPAISALPFWFVFTSLPLMFAFQTTALILVLVIFLLFNKINQKREFRPLITAEFFLLSVYSLSLLMERRLFAIVLSLLAFVIIWVWTDIHFKKNFKDEVLEENISYKTILFLIYASFFATVYGLREFIVTPVWMLIIFVGMFSVFVFNNYLVITANIIDRWKQIFTTTIIQIQLFLIYLSLPLPYYSKGALLVLTFTTINNFFEIFKNHKNDLKKYAFESVFFLTLLMLILLTTKW